MITLAECTYPEAARLARDPRSVVLLPLGAVEEHGPHLPLLVDWLGAEELARRIAPHLSRAGFQVVLAPSLPYGVSAQGRGRLRRGGVSRAEARETRCRPSRRRPCAPRLPPLRPRQLPGRSRALARHGRR